MKEIEKDWHIRDVPGRKPMLKHSCGWRASNSNELPPPGNECGPYVASARWDGEQFWCDSCGSFAPQTVEDVALLAGVYLIRHTISDALYHERFGK
jgi:hypothetical protein